MLKRPAPDLSIVVPHLGSVTQLEDTLASVLRYRSMNSQVIVVHDGSYQDPHGIGGEVDMVVAPQDSNLGGYLGVALRSSQAAIVGMVRPGVQIDEGWQADILESFEDEEVASVSPLIVREAKPTHVLTAGVNAGRGFRRKIVGQGVRVGRKAARLLPLGPSSWAAFYRRSALDCLGTPDSQLQSVYLDLDIALGLQALGKRTMLQTSCIFTVENGDEIIAESTTPHGASAARACVRFGNSTSTLVVSAVELATSPFQPWLLKHVMGKFSARAMKDVDEAFRRRLETKLVTVEYEAEPFEVPEAYRRAA